MNQDESKINEFYDELKKYINDAEEGGFDIIDECLILAFYSLLCRFHFLLQKYSSLSKVQALSILSSCVSELDSDIKEQLTIFASENINNKNAFKLHKITRRKINHE